MKLLSESEVLHILGQAWKPEQHPFLHTEIPSCHLPKLLNHLADFEGATFNSAVDFSQATFKKGVSFVGTVFKDEVDFSASTFNGPAFFWRCHFDKKVKFEHCKVRAIYHEESHRYPGEANFSYTRFKDEVSFKRTHFDGPSIFHRACFLQEVNFEECRFSAGVRFDGSRSDICLSENELLNPNFIGAAGQILVKSEDHPPNTGCMGFYNLDPEIRDSVDLWSKMELPPSEKKFGLWGGAEVTIRKPSRKVYHSKDFPAASGEKLTVNHFDVLEKLRLEYAVPTFSTYPDARAVFVRTQFKGGALFSEMNLQQASFQETNLEGVIFVSVEWAKRPLAFGPLNICGFDLVGYRDALYDETRQVGRNLLEDTYHDLRIGYQKRGVIDIARDFYFGEMELKYKDQGKFFGRIMSLAFLYRYLSGFGRQQGLAGCWLLIFSLIIFPVLFGFVVWLEPFTLDTIPGAWAKLHHVSDHHSMKGIARLLLTGIFRSLEACTFITRDPGKYPAAEKLVAGLERLVVFSQLTLFLLATKWQFERNPGSS